MSAGRKLFRKRGRKTFEEGSLDVSDDFQEATTHFRLPKRLQVSKSQENPKKNKPKHDTQEASLSCRKTLSSERSLNVPQPNSDPVKLGSETLNENSDLQEIEKSLCAESEKLCPSCKLIVPCNVFADHFKECLQKYKLTKDGHAKQFHVSGREEKTSEQEKPQPVLPCPVCKKDFKSRTQRILHSKMCAQEHGLTSEQLLLASRLLEKQYEEWNELGLPISLQPRSTGPKARSSKSNRDLKDPDIAMAVALSRSIADEKMESRLSREEKLVALGLENIVEEDRKVSPLLLPPPDSDNRLKKRGKGRKGRSQLQKTVLATRSVGERERMISEKVAVILTSEDTSRSGWQHGEPKERSGNLTSVTSKECQLWEIARGSADEPLQSFYVRELEPYIEVKEATIGNLLKKLSQIPGRLNTTALHALDEESESECEMEEATSIEEFCTQMALAGLLGSQEDLDITTEMDWEETAEGTGSQGFIISSLGNKAQDNSDSSFCKVSRNVHVVEDVENSPGDLTEVYNAEEDCVTFKENCDHRNKEEIPQTTKGSLESVISVQPLLTEYCELEKGTSLSDNMSSDYPVNSEEKRETQKIKPFIDIPLSQSECNNDTTSKGSCNFIHTNADLKEWEGTEKQPKYSSLLSSKYGLENVSVSPTSKCNEDKDKDLATSGIRSNSKISTSLFGRKESYSSSKTGMVPEYKIVTSPLKEGILANNQVSNFTSECMIQTLIQNWNDLLKSGIESDVTIATLEGIFVKAHSLVLLARCPQLYKESKEHGKFIKWNKVPQKAVHKFLSYLYTGTCEITTPGDPLWIELYDIGLKYDCKELVSYMELLYKAKNSPVKSKVPVVHPEKDKGPLLLDKELDKATEKSRKTQVKCLEKKSRNERNLMYSKSNSVSSMAVDADKTFNVEELKCTNHNDEKDHKQNESSYANKILQVCQKSVHEKQDKIECLVEFQREQSPDLFDDSPCSEKSFVISPVLNSPPLKVIPHYSSSMEIDQLEPEESKGVSNVPPKTTSPCKSVSSLGDRENMEIFSDSPLKGDSDIPDVRSVDTESKAKSSLPPAHDKCKTGDDDNDVIDLTQSGSKSNSEECVLDLPSVSKCQAETEQHSYMDKVGSMEDRNEDHESASDTLHNHYISNIWDDFDANSSITIAEELHSTSDKLAANNKSSINGPDLHLSIDAQSSSHGREPTYFANYEDHQKDKYSDKEVPTKETKFDVSPEAIRETSFVEFLEEHSGDEIFANAAAEIEKLDAVSESRLKTKSTSSTSAHPSYSLASTPHQNRNAKMNRVTPRPDYSKMKSPELKKELQKFGICALGRRKAVAVLQHVYEQTHPLVTDSEAESSFSQTPLKNSGGPKLQKIQVRKSRKCGSSPEMQNSKKYNLVEKEIEIDCDKAVHESESDPEEEEDGLLNSSLTSTSSSGGSDGGIFGDVASPDADEDILSSTQQAGLINQVQEILTSRTDLHRKVLLYEPIFVEDLHAILKANRIRCSMQALLDVLDELCVIVRTQANQKNRGRTKSSKKRRINSPQKSTQLEAT